MAATPPTTAGQPLRRPREFKAATDLLTLATGQMASRILGFLSFAILARMLTPADYGSVETLVGMFSIGLMLIEFGSGTFGIRVIASGEATLAATSRAAAGARLMSMIVIVPALVAIYGVAMAGKAPFALVLLFGLSLLAAVAKMDWLFQSRDRMEVAAGGVAIKMAVFLGAILAFPPSRNGVEAVGWAEIAAMSAMGAFYLVAQLRVFRVRPSLPRWRESLSFLVRSAPLGLSGCISTIAAAIPILFVQTFSAAGEAGEFGAAQRVVTSLVGFSWLYYQNLFPLLTRRIANDTDGARLLVRSSDTFVAWMGAAASVVLVLGAGPLMTLAFGKGLAGSSSEFSVLAWFLTITLASGSARWLLIAQNRQMSLLATQLAGAVVTIGAALLLAPAFGGVGASIAMIAGGAATWIAAGVCVWNCPVRPAWGEMILPALATAAAIAVGGVLPAPPLVAGIALGAAVLALACALPGFRRSVMVLTRAKRAV